MRILVEQSHEQYYELYHFLFNTEVKKLLAQVIFTEELNWTILFKNNTYVPQFSSALDAIAYGVQHCTIVNLQEAGVLTKSAAANIQHTLL